MKRTTRLCLAFLLLALCACQAAPTRTPRGLTPWGLADLRLLDPLDAPLPSLDILALYTRTRGSHLDIRLDLLDLEPSPDYDLALILTSPAEETLIRIPANGRPGITSSTPGLRLSVTRDPWLDTVVVHLNHRFISQPFTLQAFSYPAGGVSPADETAAVRSDSLPPTSRAPVVLAFWNVFPALTPAQALRRWDGAHTGPTGGRHGLKNLLTAIETYRLPVFLLDLKTPSNLAALQFASALPQVQRLAQHNLLQLPDVGLGQPAEVALALSRQAATSFGLPASQFVYGPSPQQMAPALGLFMELSDQTHLTRTAGMRLIPLASTSPDQATLNGPALAVRRSLIQAALSPDPSDLVSLGGSLPDSTWATGEMASPGFAWLAGHPWIWVLDSADLAVFPVASQVSLPLDNLESLDHWQEEIRQAPQNDLTLLALHASLALQAPTSNPALFSLRQAYAGQVGLLLAGARWSNTPFSQADCTSDPDQDGLPECLLSNSHYFAILQPEGARLSHLFYVDSDGAHQLVGPTSQFAIGLSDPSEWHPELGDGADPRAVLGAFSDLTGRFDLYQVSIEPDGIRMSTAELTKIFRLGEAGLEVQYLSAGPLTTSIPLAVDAQRFYASPTTYASRLSPGSFTWGLSNGVQAEVHTSAGLAAEGFTVSQVFFGAAEDPDLDFPSGHYLPFPMALVTITASGGFTVWIEAR